MLLECITDAITTPVTAGSRGVRAVAWAELGVLLLSIVALAVSARNLLLAGSQLALTRGGWSDLWRCFCTLTERRSPLRRTTIDGRGCVCRRVAVGRNLTRGACSILRTRRRTSGTGGAPAGAPAGAFAAGLAPPAGGAPPGALGDSGSGQPTNIISGRTVIRIRRVTATSSIERFTTAVSRSWQSATAFINVAPTKLTV